MLLRSYPLADPDSHELADLTARQLPYNLLRLERGRVSDREVFGPNQLHFGFAKLEADRAHYVVAREKVGGQPGPITGAGE